MPSRRLDRFPTGAGRRGLEDLEINAVAQQVRGTVGGDEIDQESSTSVKPGLRGIAGTWALAFGMAGSALAAVHTVTLFCCRCRLAMGDITLAACDL